MMQAFFWLSSPLFGCATATEVRIGNHLGAGDARAARLVAVLSFAMMGTLGILVGSSMILLRQLLGRLFTTDDAVLDLVAQIAPITGGAYILVCALFACMGILGGQGRPMPAAGAYLIGAFALSPTAGFLLGYVAPPRLRCFPFAFCEDDSQLVGIWWGFGFGYFVTTALSLAAVWFSDWECLAAEARKRSEVGAAGAGGAAAEPCPSAEVEPASSIGGHEASTPGAGAGMRAPLIGGEAT